LLAAREMDLEAHLLDTLDELRLLLGRDLGPKDDDHASAGSFPAGYEPSKRYAVERRFTFASARDSFASCTWPSRSRKNEASPGRPGAGRDSMRRTLTPARRKCASTS